MASHLFIYLIRIQLAVFVLAVAGIVIAEVSRLLSDRRELRENQVPAQAAPRARTTRNSARASLAGLAGSFALPRVTAGAMATMAALISRLH